MLPTPLSLALATADWGWRGRKPRARVAPENGGNECRGSDPHGHFPAEPHAPQRPPCLTAASACSGTCAPALPCSPSGVHVPMQVEARGGVPTPGHRHQSRPQSAIRCTSDFQTSVPEAAPSPPIRRRLSPSETCRPVGAGRRAVDRLSTSDPKSRLPEGSEAGPVGSRGSSEGWNPS